MRTLLVYPVFLLQVLQAVAFNNGNFTTIYDAIPQLSSLSLAPPSHPALGSMNITRCCLLALNDAFAVQDGYLAIVDDSFLSPGTTAESFLSAINNGQFPCGASFDGDMEGAPLVKASYKWCSVNCPGWQKSEAKSTQQWVSPLISFILPCLVFCTSIPRRRKLEVNDVLFRPTLHGIHRFILTPLRFLVAVVIINVDVLIWLALCFAFSGPMILSGVFEAFLDSRILHYVSGDGKNDLNKTMNTRLLYIILVGNLDFKWSEGISKSYPMKQNSCVASADIEKKLEGDPWQDLERLLKEPNQDAKLPSMLEVQNSFGITVGVPVAFFSGGFVYNLFDIKSALGNNDTANALAFGMWWIIVPHMAIISSLLLAGNNPFIFQTAVGGPTIKHRPVFGVFAQAYESRYKTEWLWFRGRRKYLWLQHVFRSTSKSQLKELKSSINFTILDWVKILSITWTLIFVPFILAFLTSFYTPQIGLSCRSMTFLIYFLAQMGQVTLWVWVFSTCSIDDAGTIHSPAHRSKPGPANLLSWLIYWAFAALFIGTSIFTAIGGTIMQLLGVYNNCLCALPIRYWSARYNEGLEAYVSLGLDSAQDIRAASEWWFAMGSVATAFLCAATYYGWWYQKRLRGIFRNVAENI